MFSSVPSTDNHAPAKDVGFTLIELLTVIAIIGILAAIIIPVISKVRSSARMAQCQSNLRQVGLAMMLYANEQPRNLLPGPLYGKVFPGIRQNNRKGRLAYFLAPFLQVTMTDGVVVMVPPLVCPGFAAARPDLIGVPDSENAIVFANNMQTDLIEGYDGSVWGNPDAGVGDPYGQPRALSAIANPSQRWVLTDWDADLGKRWSYGWGSEMTAARPVHGNKRNRVYFDGHVASVSLDAPSR